MPEELPKIHHSKQYEEGVVAPPDYRVTCIYVDERPGGPGSRSAVHASSLPELGVAGSRATHRTRQERVEPVS
jgi:hypothetical protein